MGEERLNTPAELPQKGDIVSDGKYRIDKLIGQGGMGAVFVGIHTTLGTRVAIKWMLPKFASDYTAVQRFLREATVAAKIRHPNVVQPIDVSDDPTKPFFIMELLEGQSLAKCVGEGRLPPDEIGRILIPVLDAVRAAHQHRIIHRDLKLDNIFLADAGSSGVIPKVLDFGIAKFADKGTFATITQDHSVLGTVQYMSPEQIVHPSDVTEQTDVYALGVIFYRLLTGTFPHRADNILDLALRIRDTPPTPLSKHLSNIPPELESAVTKALAPATDQRFPDVKSFGDAIAPFLIRNQEWMKAMRVTSAKLHGSLNRTSIAIPSASPSEAHCSTPSSLHSIEIESYRVRRRKTSYLGASLVVVVLALIGTFAWLKLQTPVTKIFSNQSPTNSEPLEQKIKLPIVTSPALSERVIQPQPKSDENEWPSLSQVEVEPEVTETEPKEPIRVDAYTPEKAPRATVQTSQASVQAYHQVTTPPPVPPVTVEPTDRRRIVYKEYSGSDTRRRASRRKPNQLHRAHPPSEIEPSDLRKVSPATTPRTRNPNLEPLSVDDFL